MTRSQQRRREHDDYQDSLVNDAPQRKAGGNTRAVEMESGNFGARNEWTSEIYSRLDGGDRKDPKHGCLSCSVLIYSVLISFFGIGIIILAYLQSKKKLLPLCPDCDDVLIGMYSYGGVVLGIGILGIAASVLRVKVLAIPYTFLISIVGLLFIGGGVYCVLISTDTVSFDLKSVWQSTVQDSPQFICDLEGKLGCSGFTVGCCMTNSTPLDPYIPLSNFSYCFLTLGNGTYVTVDGQYTPITWPNDVCVPGCINNDFTQMCDVAIKNEIHRNIIPIAASMLPFGVISIMISVFAICMTRKKGAAR